MLFKLISAVLSSVT